MLSHRSHRGLFKISNILNTLLPPGSCLPPSIFPLLSLSPVLHFWQLQAACSSPGPFLVPLVSLAGPRCLAAYKIIKGQSQPPPDGTHLYSDELFPRSQSNPTLMSYTVVNKLADKHKHKQVQTDAHIHRASYGHTPKATQAEGNLNRHTNLGSIALYKNTIAFMGFQSLCCQVELSSGIVSWTESGGFLWQFCKWSNGHFQTSTL